MSDDQHSEEWDRIEGVTAPSLTRTLLGHDAILEQMATAYANGRLHHAFLLAGPRGIGKSTLAYRFAEHILRHPDQTDAPAEMSFADDAIHSQVAKHGHPNVLTLARPYDLKTKKHKTQITVDEVRRLGHFLHSTSGADAWRICIVDPADDLNTSAANALLKMLEEPPKRTLFFILAHKPGALLPTIRSRCLVNHLKSLSLADCISVLKMQTLSKDMAEAEINDLAKIAKGSPRRALLIASTSVQQSFKAFMENLEAKNADIGKVYQISGALTPAAKSGEFQLFMDLIYDYISDLTQNDALNDQIGMRKLAANAELWQNTREAVDRAETWNMDKKQVIVDLFHGLRSVNVFP